MPWFSPASMAPYPISMDPNPTSTVIQHAVTQNSKTIFFCEKNNRNIPHQRQRSNCHPQAHTAQMQPVAAEVVSRDENGTDIFRPYSRPNSFRGV